MPPSTAGQVTMRVYHGRGGGTTTTLQNESHLSISAIIFYNGALPLLTSEEFYPSSTVVWPLSNENKLVVALVVPTRGATKLGRS